MLGRGGGFWAEYGGRMLLFLIGIGLLLLLLVVGAFTSTTMVGNTEVAIIVNNLSGGVTLQEQGGMVFHLPFGLSSVYKVDKGQRVLYLTRGQRNTEHPKGAQINIKTNDGSNVEVDVEVVYQLRSSMAFQAYRELGDEENIEDILRALTRAELRDQFGTLSTLEIAEALPRAASLKKAQQALADRLDPMGIQVISVTAQNFTFATEYDRIIRERKEADQILANQKDYQDAAREEGKRRVAEATRDKQNALAQLQGDLDKQLLAAEGDAKRILLKAQENAYKLEKEGEIALAKAEQEAAAILAEGKRKAESLETLLNAYEKGGRGLVQEALVNLYKNLTLRARPYAPSERVQRYEGILPAPGVGKQGGLEDGR